MCNTVHFLTILVLIFLSQKKQYPRKCQHNLNFCANLTMLTLGRTVDELVCKILSPHKTTKLLINSVLICHDPKLLLLLKYYGKNYLLSYNELHILQLELSLK
jgi:hypothetical protein